mgnify:FL=1
MKLIAIYPILYRSHQYEIGEELPADDSEMVQAWLDAKTAIWQDDTSQVKAKPVTAQAGLAGQSPNGETDENLVGRVPKTPARSTSRRKKE